VAEPGMLKLAQNWTGGGLGQATVVIVVWILVGMEGGNARKGGRRDGGLGQIFVAVEAHGDSYFGFGERRSGSLVSRFGGGPDYAQYAAAAAYRHILTQRDLGRHAQRELDFGAFGDGRVGEKENSPRTEILGEPNAFHPRLAQRER